MRLLMGFIFPDAGRLDRGGLAPWRIGYLLERPYFPPRSPVRDYLRTVGSLSGLHGQPLVGTVESRLEQVGLAQTAGWRIGAFSKGMPRRLAPAWAYCAHRTVHLAVGDWKELPGLLNQVAAGLSRR